MAPQAFGLGAPIEIDNGNASPWPQSAAQVFEVVNPVVEMMVGVYGQGLHRLRQAEEEQVIIAGAHGDDIAQCCAHGAFCTKAIMSSSTSTA